MDYSIATLASYNLQSMDISKADFRSKLRRYGSPFQQKVRFASWLNGNGWEKINGVANPPHWHGPPGTFPWDQYAVDLFFLWFARGTKSSDWIDIQRKYPVVIPGRSRSRSPDPAPAPAPAPARVSRVSVRM